MPDKDFIIMTESTCDLPRAYAMQHGLTVIPMSYTVDLQEYKGTEGSDLTPQVFYDKIRAGSMPKTSQVTPDEWMQYFKPHLDNGLDILLISFSSALSGTYGSARTAAGELAAQYPAQKVIVVDSKCASLGQGLLVHYALERRLSARIGAQYLPLFYGGRPALSAQGRARFQSRRRNRFDARCETRAARGR